MARKNRRHTVVAHALVTCCLIVLAQGWARREAKQPQAEARRKHSAPGVEDEWKISTAQGKHVLDGHDDNWLATLDALLDERASVSNPVRTGTPVPTPVTIVGTTAADWRGYMRAYPWIQNMTG